MKNYGIKPTYQHRDDAWVFDDTPFTDEFQPEVYDYASTVAASMGARCVVDLGCGSGFKLMKHFAHLYTVGIDLAPTIRFCREKYPERTWVVAGDSVAIGRPCLLVCSDVIEHLSNPDELLDTIERLTPDEIIISTPDRVELALG